MRVVSLTVGMRNHLCWAIRIVRMRMRVPDGPPVLATLSYAGCHYAFACPSFILRQTGPAFPLQGLFWQMQVPRCEFDFLRYCTRRLEARCNQYKATAYEARVRNDASFFTKSKIQGHSSIDVSGWGFCLGPTLRIYMTSAKPHRVRRP